MAKKNSRKELMKAIKAPDQYQKSFSRIISWLGENTLVVWAAVIPVLLIMIGVFTWQWYVEKQEWKLVDALGEIRVDYDNENRKADEKRSKISEEIASLNEKLAKIEAPKAGTKVSEQAERQRLEKEKGLLEKNLSEVKADHKKSLGRLQEFFSNHSDTPQGWMAAYKVVSIQLEAGDTAGARKTLGELLARSAQSDFYQIQGRFSYVNLLKDAGEYDEAMSELDKLQEKVDKKLMPLVLLGKAQVETLRGKKKEALDILDRLQSDYANTSEAEQAKNFKFIVKGS